MTTNSSDLFISNDLVINPFNDKFVIINPINVKSKNFWKSIINEYGGNWKNNKGGWIFPKYNLYKLKNSNTLSNKSSFCFDNNNDDLDNKDKSTQESDDNKHKNEDHNHNKNEDHNHNKNEDHNHNKDKEESSEESDDESSTDDELIQKVLARRLMSESTQDIIDNDLIEDSENEDVISLSRRLRHLYKEFNSIKNQLKH